MQKTVIAILLLGGTFLVTSQVLHAQVVPTASDQDIELLRKDLRSIKKELIAANVPLTDVEAQKFWPIYEQYTAETAKLNDSRLAIIKEYAANYNTLTDLEAGRLMKRWSDVDEAVVQLRLKYIPMVNKVLSGKKTALFFQLDRRIALIMDLQLASEIPLVQP
jgi:hypothetical protein